MTPAGGGAGRHLAPRACASVAVTLGAALLLASPPAAAQSASSSVRAPAAPPWMVVPFENADREPRVYWLGEGSAVLLTDALIAAGRPAITREHRVRAFDRLRVPLVASLSHATVIRLGQVVGAAKVIVGAFELRDDELIVRAREIQLDTGRMAPEVSATGPVGDLVSIYAAIARQLVPGDDFDVEAIESGAPPIDAFEQYIKGVLAESPVTRIGFLNQALRLHPGFQRVRVALWSAHTELSEHQAALNVVRFVPAEHRLARPAQFLAGVSLLHLGQYQQAYDVMLDLHRAVPDAALLNNIGIAQLRRPTVGTGRKASEYFSEAVAADTADPDFLFNLGYAFWLEDNPQSAIYWLREAVRHSPADDAAHYLLGVALQATGRTAEGAREKDLAKRLSSVYGEWEAAATPDRPVPEGVERMKLDFGVPAALRVEQVLVAAEQRDQQQIVAMHLEAARRLFAGERDSEAVAALRRAVYLSPYSSEAHLLLGRVYMRTGLVGEAIDALTISIWSDDTIPARLALAEAYVLARDLDAAREELRTITGRHPGNAEALRLLEALP